MGSPRSICLVDWCLVRACFLVHRCHFLAVSSHARRGRGALCGLFYLFIYILVTPHGLRDLSSPTRDRTPGPCQWECQVLTTGLRGNSLGPLLKGTTFYQVTSWPSCPNHLPKAPPPNTITLGIRFQHMSSGGDTSFQSIAVTESSVILFELESSHTNARLLLEGQCIIFVSFCHFELSISHLQLKESCAFSWAVTTFPIL